MATPNVSGLAALLRQYVIENFPDEMIKDENGEVSLKKVTAVINRLMMSTADIVYNQNGLPYSVRKQGAGLANLFNSAATGAYILTYDREDGSVMDKSKIELGDDPSKTGVYTLRFSIDNFGKSSVSYDLSAYVMTEGVSDTKTHKGDTTVTEAAYILSGEAVRAAHNDVGKLKLNKYLLGDVNNDGAVDTTDYIRIKSHFLGTLTLEGDAFKAGDVTGDGTIDTTDYIRIKGHFLGTYNLHG
jgi:hypothetical protein